MVDHKALTISYNQEVKKGEKKKEVQKTSGKRMNINSEVFMEGGGFVLEFGDYMFGAVQEGCSR